jgi:Alpha/beta hydrolase domain
VKRLLLVFLVLLSSLLLIAASEPASTVNVPTVTGPITGGKGTPTLISTTIDLAEFGYTQEEYFIEGTATAYTSDVPLSSDGLWTVRPQSSEPYKTRIVVYRPKNAKKFDGTVFVAWDNVSAGFETAPDWGSGHNAALREGAAWIAVATQAIGVQGGQTIIGQTAPGGLRASDPDRYGSLAHPGDNYSYDIFSQAGVVARSTTSPAVLGRLKVKRVIAVGESLSAFRLVTYIDAVQPIAHVFDGFLVHSRNGRGSSLSSAPLAPIPAPAGAALIRADLDVPVLQLLTESDLTILGAYPARQPDTKLLRTWEVAGTSHADFYQGPVGFGDVGDGKAEQMMLDVGAANGGSLQCAQPINYGPQHLVLNSVLEHLNRWVIDGVAPPKAQSIDMTAGPPPLINRDEHGNALGGIRTPVVDVPTATLRGDGNAGATFCFLFGNTVPFDSATLAALYPTHKAYVTKFNKSTDAAVKAGFLMPADAKNLKAAAAATTIGAP